MTGKKQNSNARFWVGIVSLLLAGLVVYPIQAYGHDFQNNVMIEKSVNLKSNEAIVINFSLPVAVNSFENGFSILPMEKVSFLWESNNKRVIIAPENFWKSQTVYEIDIKNSRNILFQKIEKKFKFETIAYPKLVSIFPGNGEKNVAVSMENPVVANFNTSLDGYNVKFVVSPKELLEYQMNSTKTQIKLLAKDDFKWETDYEIEVFIKGSKQSIDEYVKIGDTNFKTEIKPLPIEWNKDVNIRAEQAKQFTAPRVDMGKYIDINLAQQMMVIFENGKPLDAYLISSGKVGMDTPVGMFKVENKSPRAWSKKYGLWMPNWMAFVPSGEMGIHELPVWPGGYQEGASHLGTPVSHGCVRLGPVAAKRVYDWAEIGIPVVIYK